MFRLLSKFILKVSGWRVVDERPKGLGSAIYLVVPHTSNWDFFIGLFVRSALRIKANYLAKKSLFDSPLGWWFKALGGYPVDRSKSTNITEQVAAYFNSLPYFAIAITPEGTRAKVEKWKTGFWHIADQAEVPLILTSFDYPTKRVVLSAPYHTSGDKQKDIEELMAYFAQFTGKNPG